ncbi:MAG TPA: sigma 54-interacting transcriptional regulator [Nitrospiria bacterium]|nr:sigma 54-interacting transcriptional regulator [Nitrospiria bacterium]
MQRQLAAAVFLSIFFAAIAICAALFVFNQKRLFQDTVRQSREMIEAASLAFSQALADGDEVLLDAYLHELQSRKELYIQEAYVLRRDGRVMAHSRIEEYGKIYSIPDLLTEQQPTRLSEAFRENPDTFRVISLLQSQGDAVGALVVNFSTQHLTQKVQSEMSWIVGVTFPILVLSGLGVMLYGRRMVNRLRNLQRKALEIGRGEWGEPIEVAGKDEISQLIGAFNQMRHDLSQLQAKNNKSVETIEALNRDLTDQLTTIRQLKEQLAEENAALREELRSQHTPDEMIGANGSLRPILDQARQLASLPITVLITGESGTGKELLATFLHETGSRRNGPFVKVNCAALPITLIESELFGHEKGSFTGAVGLKKGKFELAHGGTLFLDEVGELPAEAQAKLLWALQEGEIQRVGGNHPILVDARVIAATNRDLSGDVKQGKFRDDLYYRLKVVELRCPPLRERLEDLPVLAQHFIEQYSRKLGKPVVGISPSALKALANYSWPGNIRELENMVARAVALATTQVLGPEDFLSLQMPMSNQRSAMNQTNPSSIFERLLDLCGIAPQELNHDGWERVLTACERICLQSMLEKTRKQKEAANALGLTETKLHRLIRKHGLKNR